MNRSRPLCRICGDIARGYNFGVITCMPCKAFFRRNALRTPGSLTCMKNNDCTINKDNRSDCSACRLQKCFIFGMKRQAIQIYDRSDTSIDWQNNLPLPQPIGLLRQDRSMMTMDEWNLLSNLIYIHEREDITSDFHQTLSETNNLPLKKRSKPILVSNYINQATRSLRSMIKICKDFGDLMIDTRRRLIRNNILYTNCLNAFTVNKHLTIWKEHAHFLVAMEAVFGSDFTRCASWLLDHVYKNELCAKLFMFIMMFSSNFSIVEYNEQFKPQLSTPSLDFLRIQDTYVAMLWKYMLYRFGFTDAVLIYSSMIQNVLVLYECQDEWNKLPLIRMHFNSSLVEAEAALLPREEN